MTEGLGPLQARTQTGLPAGGIYNKRQLLSQLPFIVVEISGIEPLTS